MFIEYWQLKTEDLEQAKKNIEDVLTRRAEQEKIHKKNEKDRKEKYDKWLAAYREPARTFEILRQRDQEKLLLREIAANFSVSQERIRQIIAKGRRMRKQCPNWNKDSAA